MNKLVDALGVACPGPVIMTKEALNGMTEGTVTVLVDNEAAVQNVKKMAGHLGFTAEDHKKEEKKFEILISVSGAAAKPAEAAAEDPEEEENTEDEVKKGLLVAISSDRMGSGNDELGKVLMKGFVFALTKQDHIPEAVLLYNGGATLSVEGSESLEDLRDLESRGTEILTCGTCLNYYNIADKLAVGGVSNMYEIVERLEQAKKVVRP